MKTTLWLVGLVVMVLAAQGQQPVPPAASPAEVAAGTDRYKYLTPYAAASSGISSNGITAAGATNIIQALLSTNIANSDGITAAGATNIIQALLSTNIANSAKLAPDGYGIASTNLASIGAAGPKHMNEGQMLFTALKIASRAASFNLPGVVAVLGFGDNAIPASSSPPYSFQYVIHNGFNSFLPWAGSIFGGTRADGGLNYMVGTCSQTPVANLLWQGPYATYGNGQTATNTHTGITGINATHLVLNTAQSNGFGSFQIYTQSAGVSTMALFRTVNNNNSTLYTPYTTNIYLGALISNCVAAVVSTGTNVTYGQLACGLYNTNGPGYIFDDLFGSNVDMLYAMTNSAQSNVYRVFLKPYFDGLLVSDLNNSNAIYQGTKLWTEMMAPTAEANSWHTDFILMSGSPTTNSAASADTRIAFNRACLDFNVAGFDSYGLFGTDAIARLYSMVALNDVHFTNYVGRMVGTKFIDWTGWSYGHQMQNGYTLRDATLTSLPYVALTNGIAYGTFKVNPGNDRLFMVTNYSASETVVYLGLQPTTAPVAANFVLLGDDSGTVNFNAGNQMLMRVQNDPRIWITPDKGVIVGNGFANSANPGDGVVRFNGNVSISGNLSLSNYLAFRTNYTVGNFTPVSGFWNLVASNNSGYSTARDKTNLVVAP